MDIIRPTIKQEAIDPNIHSVKILYAAIVAVLIIHSALAQRHCFQF